MVDIGGTLSRRSDIARHQPCMYIPTPRLESLSLSLSLSADPRSITVVIGLHSPYIVYEPEPLNGCHWYTKDGIFPLYIFEMAYVSRLLKIMPTSSGAQLLLCWQ